MIDGNKLSKIIRYGLKPYIFFDSLTGMSIRYSGVQYNERLIFHFESDYDEIYLSSLFSELDHFKVVGINVPADSRK